MRQMKEKLRIRAVDDTEIPALHIKRGGKYLLIASHGITSEKTEEGLYERFVELLPASYDAILFDFRGHGESNLDSMKVTIAGELLDLMAVFRWARKQNYSAIDHVATSFGSSITLLAVSAYGLVFLRRVAFWNPVISYQNTFINGTPEWGKTFFNQTTKDELADRAYTQISDSKFRISAQMTQELLLLHPENVRWPESIPLFVLHGDQDTLVPVSDAKAYARANNARIKILEGVDHGFDHRANEAMQLTASWLQE